MTWGQEWGSLWGGSGVEEYILAQNLTILRQSPEWLDLLGFLAEALEIVDAAIGRTSAAINLGTSTGVHLDLHGAGLRLSRQGADDDEYRQAIAAQYVALFRRPSSDLVYELIETLTEGTIASVSYRDRDPANIALVITDSGSDRGERWETLFRIAKPDGVGMTTQIIPDSATVYRLDIGPGLDQGEYSYTLD